MTRTAIKTIVQPLRVLAMVMFLTACLAMVGCEFAWWAGSNMGLGDEPEREATAEYTSLNDKVVAVLVSADDHTLFRHPNVQETICQNVTATLNQAVDGVNLVDPIQLATFQRDNPYWVAVPYSDVLRRLSSGGTRVDRLVVIDVARFTTRDPATAHTWRGVIIANIGVSEAESPTADDHTYSTSVTAMYPTDRPVNLAQADEQTIELGLVREFSRRVANLFRDHAVPGEQQ
ncbi:MAG: hypothetical protein QF785_13680 [Phycisphaeraceae bacterium]|jgi:hypothetical protein|nr:hypothetical protein [Phycisphaeraceae bacterium]MDP7348101.1 hypothetical protein [Phycisphaeraceae bacterium]